MSRSPAEALARRSPLAELAARLSQARAFLGAAAAGIPAHRWTERPSPAYSPVGWHVGHVAATLLRWLLPDDVAAGEMSRLFDPFVTPKGAREALPPADALLRELDRVHARAEAAVLAGRIPAAPQAAECGLPIEFLPAHLVQHELQHAEHVRTISALLQGMPAGVRVRGGSERISFAGGEAWIGSDDAAEAYDNERPRHLVRLQPFWIARDLVSAAEYAEFAEATGREPPLFAGAPDSPASGISWIDADAYARFRGARLPTEFEWEHAAAHLRDASGIVWQWTTSWFQPYEGFRAYPYDGYSVPWFGTHRVLRGGSFATHPSICRPSFRNWYEPGFRELFAGLRLAGELP